MYRDIAVTVLKEILDKLPDMPATAITLMMSNAVGKGYYHLHISASLDEPDRTCLKAIALEHGLQYRENEGRILIYKSLI